jgi:hypothetical protein
MSMRIKRESAVCRGAWLTGIVTAVGLAAAGWTTTAGAEDFNLITAKANASLGTFLNSNELKIRVDGEAGDIGTVIDWGDTFGGGEQSRFRLDGVWRFNEKHHLRVMLTDYSTSRTRTLKEDIEWGDDYILAGSSTTGKVGFSIAEVAYEYALKHKENMELALTAGIHYTTFEAKLTARLDTSIGDQQGQLGGKASVDAPLPVFGARGMWRLGGDFYLDAMIQWFALSIDQYDGSLINYRGAVIWQPKQWVGIGAGYDVFNVDVDVKKKSFTGSMDWTYKGPQIFFNVGF